MRVEDARRVAEIHTASWRHAYRGIVDQAFLDALDINKRETNWRNGIEKNDPAIVRLVAVERRDGNQEKERIVGFVCGLDNRKKDLVPGCDSELWAIYVDPASERRGVGSALLSSFFLELKKLNRKKCAVWTFEDNSVSRGFYLKQGGKLSHPTDVLKIGDQNFLCVAYEFENF